MHSPKHLILFIGAVAGFTIPTGQPDGVYAVSYDKNDVAVHTFIAEPVNRTEVAQVSAPAREFSRPSRLAAKTDGRVRLPALRIESRRYRCGRGSAEAPMPARCYQQWLRLLFDHWKYCCLCLQYGPHRHRLPEGRSSPTHFSQITGVCGSYGSGWRTKWLDSNTGSTTGYEDRGAKFCGRGT